jgi:hypothetical protein
MEILKEYLPFLIPLIIAQLALGITALIHVIKHPHYRFGNMIMWALVVMLVNIIGPLVYFVWGRGEDR